MANPIPTQLSPGVKVSEIDLSQFVQPESLNSAGMVGVFNWGPVLVPTKVTTESNLATLFGKPTLDPSDKATSTDFFGAANFLRYSNNLTVVRLEQSSMANATSTDPGISTIGDVDNRLIKSLEDFRDLGGFSGSDGIESVAHFRARYPGNFGNSLKVIVNDGTDSASSTENIIYRDYVLSGGYDLASITGVSSGTIGYTFSAYGTAIGGIALPGNVLIGSTGATLGYFLISLVVPDNKSEAQFINELPQAFNIFYATGSTASNLSLTNSGTNPDGNASNYNVLESIVDTPGTPFNPFSKFATTNNIFVKTTNAKEVSILFLNGDSTNMNSAVKIGGRWTPSTTTFNVREIRFDAVSGVPGDFGSLIFTDQIEQVGNFDNYRFNWSNLNTYIGSITSGVKGWAKLVGLTGGVSIQKTTNGVVGTVGVTFDSVGGLAGIKRDFAFGMKQFGYNAVEVVEGTNARFSIFDKVPGTSEFVTNNGGSNDEISFAVIDVNGKFGPKNGLLEKFELLSKAVDAKSLDGESIYYKDYINNNSQYVYITKPFGLTGGGDASSTSTTAFGDITSKYVAGGITLDRVGFYENTLQYGTAVASPTTAQKQEAYTKFVDDANAVDILFINESTTTNDTASNETIVESLVYDTVIEPRKDTILVIPTPAPANVAQHPAQAAANAVNFRKNILTVPSNSYTMLVAGRKVYFDTYNNQTRKLSLASDVAGLLSAQEIPWESPAGFARGMLKNVIKLETNFSKADRDELYKDQINFFVAFNDGSGTVLFGDKTLLVKPSAFDRINVRRVFIAAEKAIAKAAKYSLFEFNDEFTRSQFRNLVNPFLANLQAQRGIADFKVVCDETNNTAEVIDKNQFVADIYIKPLKSINFIQLNFIAVRSDFNLTTIE